MAGNNSYLLVPATLGVKRGFVPFILPFPPVEIHTHIAYQKFANLYKTYTFIALNRSRLPPTKVTFNIARAPCTECRCGPPIPRSEHVRPAQMTPKIWETAESRLYHGTYVTRRHKTVTKFSKPQDSRQTDI